MLLRTSLLHFLWLASGHSTNKSLVMGAEASLDSFVSFLQNNIPAITDKDATVLPGSFSYDGTYSISTTSQRSVLRKTAIATKRILFLYGPPVAGGPFFPTGLGGSARVAADILALQQDISPELVNAALDATKLSASQKSLNTMADYEKLYTNNLAYTLPRGPDDGGLSNYTEDLFFAMERLSNSPYQLRRLRPPSDQPSFAMDDSIVKRITGFTLDDLFIAGRLFYADYRTQGRLPKSNQYGAACDAYFYISPRSGDLLPLAIRTNVGSNLIYSPEDPPNDWLLAKIMFNVNDFWFSQWNHLASTHEVVQIVYMAAIRTLSEEHPVLGLLHRLMYEVFAIQPLAEAILFAPGGVVDELFPFSGQAAMDYSTSCYESSGGGRFAANYFLSDLESRGLIQSDTGPTLKHFPFYEDAQIILTAIQTFMAAFVGSYYSSDSAVAQDDELQAWSTEARGPAKAIDFPLILTKGDLVAALTHMAHLVSVAHHTSNTNELLEISSLLPFHPTALYQEPPTSKGVENIVEYLPPFDKVVAQLAVGGLFARPNFVGSNRTLIHMFDDVAMLSRMNEATFAAAQRFKAEMVDFSDVVQARHFDAAGLSQGMPFLWKALDPNVAPYSITT